MHINMLVLALDENDVLDILNNGVQRGYDYYDDEYFSRTDSKGISLNDDSDKSQYTAYILEDEEYVRSAKINDVNIDKTLKYVSGIITYRNCIYDWDFMDDLNDMEGREKFEEFTRNIIKNSIDEMAFIVDVHF